MEKSRLDLAPVSEKDGESTERYETIDYVRELLLLAAEQKETDRKRMKLLRTAVALLCVLTLVFTAGMAILVPTVLQTARETNQAIAAINDTDFSVLVADVDAFTQQANEAFVAVSDAVEVLNDLDMATLNAAISQLEITVDALSQIDVAMLNSAIENLNATVEPMANFFGLFNKNN